MIPIRFTVVSQPDAQDKLAEIWLRAPDQNAVTLASDEIDLLLKHFPIQVGRPYGDYLHFVHEPLEVIHTVQPEDRLVRIVDFFYVDE